ncbi:MAG: tRNA (guanosine(46)-N7)-methyltransferase TrmB [Pirellulaceae bacterium]|nr:tRNA (guanosine(46)-N7)-methyltransferase TrmB [Pirellulaceae bacterium]
MNHRSRKTQASRPGAAIDVRTASLDWATIIAAQADKPRELEIGSGKGLFLQSAAHAQPERHFIGIELAAKFAHRSAERLARLGLANVTVLCGDARAVLHSTVPDQSIQRVHVYFPDPWWRNKHKKRRVLNDQTLQDIQRVLVSGGQFHFWTDVLDYYQHICAEVMDTTELAGPHYIPERAASHAMDYTTHFERRARLNSQPVYRALFEKRSSTVEL